MTTQKEIDEQIQKEGIAFMNKVFDYAIPDSLIRAFRNAVMAIPLGVSKINIAYLKNLGDKRTDEITHADADMMLKIMSQVPPKDMYDDYEEFLKEGPLVQEMGVVLKKILTEKEQKLRAKQLRLSQLAGITGNSVPFKGLVMAEA